MRTIRNKLLINFLVILLIPILGLFIVYRISLKNRVIEIKKSSVLVGSRNVFHALDMQRVRLIRIIKSTTESSDFIKFFKKRDKKSLTNALSYFMQNEGFIHAQAINSKGKIIYKKSKNKKIIIKKSYKRVHFRNEPVMRLDEKGNLYIYTTIKDNDKYIGQFLFLLPFYKEISTHTRKYFPTFFEYFYLSTLSPNNSYSSFNDEIKMNDIRKEGKYFFANSKGILYIGYSKPLQDEVDGMFKGVLIIFFPARDVQKVVSESTYIQIMFLFGALILSFFIAHFRAKGLAKPILSLIDATKKISKGKFTAKINVVTNDEIGELSKNFSNMLKNLKMKDKKVKEKTNQLRASNMELAIKSEEVLKLKNFMQRIIDSLPSALVTVDNYGKLMYWNEKAKLRFGDSCDIDYTGEKIFTVCKELEKFKSQYEEVFEYKKPVVLEQVVNDNGNYEDIIIFPIMFDNFLIGIGFNIMDVNQRVKAKQMMLEAEKLRSIGTISAALAHEIRNPLGIMKSSAEVIQEKLDKDEPSYRAADFIRIEVERLNKLITDLLDFAKPKSFDFNKMSVNKLLLELTLQLEKEFSERKLELILQLDENIPKIKIDEGYFHQVILNLLYNARDASSPGDNIFIITKVEANNVLVIIRDQGHGMDVETMNKIFDPFFTLKPQGTGLGLIVVKQLIEGMGGNIEVYSEINKGTEFVIKFLITE